MLRKIKLHGELAKFVGHDEFEAVAHTSAEAIRFLVCNFPDVEAYMSDKYYKVLVKDGAITKDGLHDPIGGSEINIVPVISGAGGNNFNQILLGGLLIGASFLFPGAGMFGKVGLGGSGVAGAGYSGLAVAGGTLTKIGTALSGIGAALVLNGTYNMIFPQPIPEEQEDDPRISFAFNGIVNTTRAGTSHPIVYGEIVTGSVVISAGIDTNQVSA